MKHMVAALAIVCAGCTSGTPPPAPLDTRAETCRNCRMVVSDIHFAAQIVGGGDEPRFFDDLGCLHAYLSREALPRDAVVYVADHRTGAWVAAESAVFTRLSSVATPMGGGMAAHADLASRSADPAAAGGELVPWQAIAGGTR